MVNGKVVGILEGGSEAGRDLVEREREAGGASVFLTKLNVATAESGREEVHLLVGATLRRRGGRVSASRLLLTICPRSTRPRATASFAIEISCPQHRQPTPGRFGTARQRWPGPSGDERARTRLSPFRCEKSQVAIYDCWNESRFMAKNRRTIPGRRKRSREISAMFSSSRV